VWLSLTRVRDVLSVLVASEKIANTPFRRMWRSQKTKPEDKSNSIIESIGNGELLSAGRGFGPGEERKRP